MRLFLTERLRFRSKAETMKKLVVTFLVTIFAFTAGCGKFPELGNGYFFDYDPRGDFALLRHFQEGDSPTIFIYGHILEYGVDSTFVVIAQRPRDSVVECTGKIPGMTFDRCEDAFKKSTFSQYWILNKKEKPEYTDRPGIYSNVYGPYTKAEYMQALEKLGVPKGLQLKKL